MEQDMKKKDIKDKNAAKKSSEKISAAMEAARRFQVRGSFYSMTPYGNGHINDTYLFQTKENEKIHSYILQRINHHVFKDPEGLMENIRLVTAFLRRKIRENGGDPERETLTLIPADSGRILYQDPGDSFWRCYLFIENTLCLEQANSPEDFRESGRAFGAFQQMLNDFPASTLSQSIPDFHNTPLRYQRLLDAVKKDPLHRVRKAESELAFLEARARQLDSAARLSADGRLPLRVTHNDTKLNNVLFDAASRKSLCVIDLDTIMPGLSIYDFGDAIRFGANTALEDEADLSKVSLSLPLYRAFSQGFLEKAGTILTDEELYMLPMGAKLMTLECGIRFLTDYLEGDVYFKIQRPDHNLDRTRVQLALIKDMEEKWDAMTIRSL